MASPDTVWRDCADWLIRCKVLPPDHRVSLPEADVVDLAHTLRDGVILCHLLNKLLPGSVDQKEVNLKPQMSQVVLDSLYSDIISRIEQRVIYLYLIQFLCMKNIRTFLSTCRNVFGIRELFEPHMLFDCNDFKKVLQTLSLLSKCSHAAKTGIPGFSLPSSTPEYYNDEMFKNLRDTASRELEEAVYGELANDGEDIYHRICHAPIKAKRSTGAPLEHRDHCINELIDTEKNYVNALHMMQQHFMRPLANTLSRDDHDIVFRHIRTLHDLHESFLRNIQRELVKGGLGESFVRFKERFTIYGDYCSHLLVAQEHIDALCAKSETINQAVQRCELEANQGRYKLRDLLSVPMQRVLKYHLLLRELLKHTCSATYADYDSVKRALDAMLDLAEYINEVKRDNEALQIITDIQNSMTDCNLPEDMELKDYGRLLKDGEIRVKSHDDPRTKTRYIFVFDKMMLMCKATKGEQYVFKDSLALCNYRVEDVNTNFIKGGARWQYQFLLANKDNRNAFTIYTKTAESKRKWIDAIQRALDNISPAECSLTNHHLQMHTAPVPTNCDHCGNLLKGIFFQGYRCDECAMVFHRSCIITGMRACGAAPRAPARPLANGDSPLGCVRARTSYAGSREGHLSFNTDDVIFVLRKSTTSPDLWEGRLQRTGHQGLFPCNLVEDINKRSSLDGSRSICASPTRSLPTSPLTIMNLEQYPWYAGDMPRERADKLLTSGPSGAFLVRISNKQDAGYAISMNYNGEVKHMRVLINHDGLYCLSVKKLFKNIVELVNWYEVNSLSESFNGLEATLSCPYASPPSSPPSHTTSPLTVQNNAAQLIHATVIHAYEPEQNSSDGHLLPLRKGDTVLVLSREGEERGWWKGQCGQSVGFFPKAYVQILSLTETTGLT